MPAFGHSRRRQIVVDRGFQYRAAVVGVIYIVAVAVIIAVPTLRMMEALDSLLPGQGEELRAAFEAQRLNAIVLFGVFLSGLIAFWILFTLWRTHKVAGPIVKITRRIHDIGAGKFDETLQLRSGDELQALANGLNTMAESLNERDQTIKAGILSRIKDAENEAQRAASPQATLDALRRLADAIARAYEPATSSDSEVEDLVRDPHGP